LETYLSTTFTGRAYLSETDIATLTQLAERQAEQAEAKVHRFTDPREKNFYQEIATRLTTFAANLSRCPSGALLFTESDLKWLASLVSHEQRSTQSRFDAARLQGSREAIALGGQLERLYSLSYQIAQPLERRARAVARALKAEEAAVALAREEEIARITEKRRLQQQQRATRPRPTSSTPRPKPYGKPRQDKAFFQELAPKTEKASEQLSALADLFKS
jgi:hypothetical protein